MLQLIQGNDAACLEHHRTRHERRLKDMLPRLANARPRAGNSQGAPKAMNAGWAQPGPVARKERVLAAPGLDRAMRLLDTTCERLLVL